MRILKLWPLPLLLAGCDSLERMNAANNETSVQIAALQSQAVVGAEWARTQAAASVAQSQAISEVARNAAWAAQLPWLVLAVCVTVVIVAYIWYRSRVVYQSSYPPAQVLPSVPGVTILPTPAQRWAALNFAHKYGVNEVRWTPDGRPIVIINGEERTLRITAKETSG